MTTILRVLIPVILWTGVVHADPTPDIRTELTQATLHYFLDNAHPVTGLVRDRALNFAQTPESNRAASIAATGFGLAIIANAGVRGLVPRETAEDYVAKTLRFARAQVPRRKGWFLHFIDWETGQRIWDSEYSTIDTALFIGGALYAAQVFRGNQEISGLATELYDDIDFQDAMTNGGAEPNKRTLSMAYVEGFGFTPSQWDMYAEQKLLLILGLGHPTYPLPAESWLAIDRRTDVLPDGREVMGLKQALFVHQYSEAFIDFTGLNDGFKNYSDNSRIMADYHRIVGKMDHRYRTLREGFWGFSAGDSPLGYRVWSPVDYQSTVCISCVPASAMLMPDVILKDISDWANGPYRSQLWGRYGFVDSLDLDRNWFGPEVLGITVGPEYMAMANLSAPTSIWKDFMQIPAIRRGLDRAATATRLTMAK